MGRPKNPNGPAKKPGPVKKTYEISEELKVVAEEVINEHKLDVYPSKLGYILVYPYISKTTAGRCVRSKNELKHFSGFDYLIEMSGELWDALDSDVRKILMLHELKHVCPTMNEKTQEWDFRLRDHDVQDFASIINKYGVDWISKVKASSASLYEVEEDDVKI